MSSILPPNRPETPAAPLPRRSFLAASLLGATATLFAAKASSQAQAAPGAGAPQAAPERFVEISQLLTGHSINGALGERAWQALVQREKNFPQRFSQLQSAIDKAGLHDMQQWKTSSIASDAELKATALAIVSAWYLGVVGQVKDRSEDGPAFITYESALMWRPTWDVTVIPTYARGGPGYWKAKPATVATD
ncbi:sugar dehydrogenase complex small subunit [Frateuria aurantia]